MVLMLVTGNSGDKAGGRISCRHSSPTCFCHLSCS